VHERLVETRLVVDLRGHRRDNDDSACVRGDCAQSTWPSVRCLERPRQLTLLVSLIDPYLGGRLSGVEHAEYIGLVCKGKST
jgi:hypothetical protein